MGATVPVEPSDTVVVSNLPRKWDAGEVTQVIGSYGLVVGVRMMPAAPSASSSAAVVQFESVEVATWIFDNLDGNIPEGLVDPVSVRYCRHGSSPGANRELPAAPRPELPAAPVAPVPEQPPWARQRPRPPAEAPPLQARCMAAPPPRHRAPMLVPAPAPRTLPKQPPPPIPEAISGCADGSKQNCNKASLMTCPVAHLVRVCQTTGRLGPGSSRASPPEQTVYVKHLPKDTTDLDLYHLFSPFGPICCNGAKAVLDSATGHCKGIAFVNYLDAKSALAAVEALNGVTVEGKALNVEINHKPSARGVEVSNRPPIRSGSNYPRQRPY